MRELLQVGRAARRWQVLVGVRWLRWQGQISALYFYRVTYPVQAWVAFGCPEQYRPSLPWWQPFVFSYLVTIGWVRASRRREYPV